MGTITQSLFLALVVPLLAARRARAAVEADVNVSEHLDDEPVGLWLPDRSEHYTKSFSTVLTIIDEVLPGEADRLTALVESIEADSTQEATQKAMKFHDVEKYQFVAGSDACDECKADNGKIYPVSRNPSHHRNCNCEAKPIKENP
ncbi:phage head morphogenesis protein [Dermacoccus sp. PAMC28757]|uniref:phage head morphogenesis protein n=1 Tax=Dermacoccus sp. PAMC28757 TaxID=2762331 RepID=UPI001C9B267E|nr:phage head morphogenesis protein [Dermacoccus sp. PAMC28757]